MGAQYYGADSGNGDRIDDPSEDALLMSRSLLDSGRSRSRACPQPVTRGVQGHLDVVAP